MRYLSPTSVTVLSLLLAGLALAPTVYPQDSSVQSAPAGQSDAPLTDQQIRALANRVLNNQHQNDLLLQQYDRTEHEQLHGKGVSNKEMLARVVPTGTGEARVELRRDGIPTDAALQERQWHAVTEALATNSRTDDPEVRRAYERAAKRGHERAEIVDAIGKAFRFHYVGRVTLSGRKLLELSFDPEPGFHSSIRYASICAHIHGKLWVDESSAEVVRIEAELFDDYSLAGGLLAKIYHGSSAILEQSEVEPGVWMPMRAEYDFTGRKLLFGVTMHEQIEDSQYRRIGPPREALQAIGVERSGQTLENVKNQR